MQRCIQRRIRCHQVVPRSTASQGLTNLGEIGFHHRAHLSPGRTGVKGLGFGADIPAFLAKPPRGK